jgi:hypothetical protein
MLSKLHNVSPYSPPAFPPKGKSSIHYEILRVVIKPAQAWEISITYLETRKNSHEITTKGLKIEAISTT